MTTQRLICFLFIVILNTQLIDCAKEKIFYSDDSNESKPDSWSVEFPKNDKHKPSYSKNDFGYSYVKEPTTYGKIMNVEGDYTYDNSYENKNNYQDDSRPYDDDYNRKPNFNDFNDLNKPYNDFDTHNSYDKFDYDSNFKKPQYNHDDYSNFNKKPDSYSVSPAPAPATNRPPVYNNDQYGPNKESSYENNQYGNRPDNYRPDSSEYNKPDNYRPDSNNYNKPDNYRPDSNDYNKQDNYKPDSNNYNKPPISNYGPQHRPTIAPPNKYNDNSQYSSNDRPYVNKPQQSYDSKPDVYNPDHSTYKLTCYDREETCLPQKKCPINRFDDFDAVQRCTLHDGEFGICCPPAEPLTQRGPPNNLPITKKATKNIYPKRLKYYPEANKNQYRSLNDYDTRSKFVKQIERALTSRKLVPPKSSAEFAHSNFFGFHKKAAKMGEKGERMIQRALEIAKRYSSEPRPTKTLDELIGSYSTNINVNSNTTDCPKDPICGPPSKYRTPDGSCNNRLYPSYGQAFSAYNRILVPDYADGLNSPRLSKSKEELPNARQISVELTRHKLPPTSRLSLATMQFGQFIDHDVASAAPTRTSEGSPISCCRPEVQEDPINLKHPACYEIQISKNDPFYEQFNLTCMNFVRSAATLHSDCKPLPREQLNQPTSFIDGSQIYGSSKETQFSLRSFSGGQLLSSLINNAQFLPPQTNGTCNVPGNDFQQCTRAGDPRSNENIDLTVMQTIFLREHNRIANELQELNPNWNDETLYQEAKRIVTAELQHITYSEFLPSVLNRQTMKQFDLNVNDEGYTYKYDPKINPMLFNSFASSAYRWHSSIVGLLQLRNNKDELTGDVPLSNTFNNPTLLRLPGMYDSLIRGMTSQPMQELDQYFTTEITNRLFRPWNSSFGLDIFALNIQRGRDHGLRGYTRYQKQCGLEPIKNFNDLDSRMAKHLVYFFKRHYESVHDIDLYAGGIVENHLPNSELGPTFSCLVAEQFRRLKYGDSFWYENANQPGSFRPDQLAEIKKVTLARLLCDNGDNVELMQPHAFILPKYWWNKKVSCHSELIDRMCLSPWSIPKY